MRPKNRPNDKDRRNRILTCAADLIAEGGIAAVTARAVANRAEVPVGSVSYYFSSQKELIVEAAQMIATSRQAELDEWSLAIVSASGESGEGAATNIKVHLAELIVRHLNEQRQITIASYELTFAGLRDDALRAIALSVASALEDCLARFMSREAARSLSVLADGAQFALLMRGGAVTVDDALRYLS